MKISITLNEFPVERLSALAAFLAGSTAVITAAPIGNGMPAGAPQMPAPAAPDNDEAGDTAAAPGTVDARGIPWDDRIHSTPAKLTSKNVWRAKRGVDDATVAAVEAELRSRQPVPQTAPPAAPAQHFPPPQPQPAVFPPGQGYPAIPATVVHNPPAPQPAYVPPQPQPEYQPPVQQQAPAPAAPQQLDFPAFMAKLQGILAMRDGNGQAILTADYLANVTQRVSAAYGVPAQSVMDFQTRPDIIQYIVQLMASEGKWF